MRRREAEVWGNASAAWLRRMALLGIASSQCSDVLTPNLFGPCAGGEFAPVPVTILPMPPPTSARGGRLCAPGGEVSHPGREVEMPSGSPFEDVTVTIPIALGRGSVLGSTTSSFGLHCPLGEDGAIQGVLEVRACRPWQRRFPRARARSKGDRQRRSRGGLRRARVGRVERDAETPRGGSATSSAVSREPTRRALPSACVCLTATRSKAVDDVRVTSKSS